MLKRPVLLGALLVIAVLCTGNAATQGKNTKMATTEMLVNTCVACHGTRGISAGPAIPSIAGFTRNYLIGAMLSFKFHDDPDALKKIIDERGEAYEDVLAFSRYSTIMSRIATGYTIEEIEAIADYFAAQEPQAVRQQVDADRSSQGKKLHKAKCEKCHEDGGSSPVDDVGILAGQWMPYLRYTLQDYFDGKREMPKKMRTKLKELHKEHSEEGVESLIHYYGSAK